MPLNFRYLTHLKLHNIDIEDYGREMIQFILSGCQDLEKLDMFFKSTAFFVSDFLLDDILFQNPLARLEDFLMRNASLTLISALRLLTSRPKIKTIGHILQWDVEPSELETFGTIIKRAKSLNLLHNDVIFL